ncbi:hypothetical protein EJ08DRAFT_701965 [Tothia fuscella]|uniref:F-box domain-containing protein n=1 Tax=Tothia fuscella TaxID=1048955 RepID=A0A9P4NHT8_9PEZI|nr:hypothetical protein EJ08DRAFT_701965 [Tothia fuscella]
MSSNNINYHNDDNFNLHTTLIFYTTPTLQMANHCRRTHEQHVVSVAFIFSLINLLTTAGVALHLFLFGSGSHTPPLTRTSRFPVALRFTPFAVWIFMLSNGMSDKRLDDESEILMYYSCLSIVLSIIIVLSHVVFGPFVPPQWCSGFVRSKTNSLSRPRSLQTSHFERLPAELRHKIYGYLDYPLIKREMLLDINGKLPKNGPRIQIAFRTQFHTGYDRTMCFEYKSTTEGSSNQYQRVEIFPQLQMMLVNRAIYEELKELLYAESILSNSYLESRVLIGDDTVGVLIPKQFRSVSHVTLGPFGDDHSRWCCIFILQT